jgi:hypothetical protein
MNRRQFLTTSAGSSLFVALPGAAHAADMIDFAELPPQIQALERTLSQNPLVFRWDVHNELRHLYLGVDEFRSHLHADRILQYTIMDDYTLNTLSDWHLSTYGVPQDSQLGIAKLIQKAQTIPSPILKRSSNLLKNIKFDAKVGFIKGHKMSNFRQNHDFSGLLNFGEGIVMDT